MSQTWEISKSFDFCFGHRVWTQTLNSDFSLDQCSVCRHLHGHQGKIIVYLKSNKLKNGMITDFAHLNWFKKFLDDTLDHRFLIDINDPLFPTLLPKYAKKTNLKKVNNKYKIADLSSYTLTKEEIELYESFIILDFVPTSENISSWLLHIVNDKMKEINIQVSKIDFYETPKSMSSVTIGNNDE